MQRRGGGRMMEIPSRATVITQKLPESRNEMRSSASHSPFRIWLAVRLDPANGEPPHGKFQPVPMSK